MKLDHLVIALSDLKTGIGFYEALLPLLGFCKQRDWVFGNDDGIFLDFRQSQQPELGYHRHAPGLNHLGFDVGSLSEIVRIRDAMSGAGFEPPEIQKFSDGDAMFLKDADGMRVEVGHHRC